MSNYPTITLGGFITSDEVTELAALLAESDRYPDIMTDEGDVWCYSQVPFDDDERRKFYLDAINRSIQKGQPFRFGTGDPDWRTHRMGGTASDYISREMEIWFAAKASRLISRRYTPQQSIVLHGCGWGGQSVRLDTDDNPIIALPENTFRRTSGQPLDLEHVDMWKVSKFLRKMYDAHLVWETPIPALMWAENEYLPSPLPRRPSFPKLGLILE